MTGTAAPVGTGGVTPSSLTLQVGGTGQLTATARDAGFPAFEARAEALAGSAFAREGREGDADRALERGRAILDRAARRIEDEAVRRPDQTILLRSPQPPAPHARAAGDGLRRRGAQAAPQTLVVKTVNGKQQLVAVQPGALGAPHATTTTSGVVRP